MTERKKYAPIISLIALHEDCQSSIFPWDKNAYRRTFLSKLIDVSKGSSPFSHIGQLYSCIADACRNKECNKASMYLKEAEEKLK